MSAPRSGSSRVFALLGDPVSHSLSPVFQNAALRACGLDGAYVALRCSAGEVPGLIRELALAGGGGNVTVPHKEVAVGALDAPEDDVIRTGACNTFWGEAGTVRGANTDVDAIRVSVRSVLGGPPEGARVALLGAGGAARAAAVALLTEGVDRILVSNRTRARAERLVAEIDDDRLVVTSSASEIRGADLLVQATSVGLLHDDPSAIDLDEAALPGAVLDLVYRAEGTTRLVVSARALGVPAEDGRTMLLHQGAAAFSRWWGRPAPIEAMGEALQGSSAVPGGVGAVER